MIDMVTVTVDGVEHRIARGAAETTLPDGRVLIACWGSASPQTLLGYDVVQAPAARAARAARATDRIATALRCLICEASTEHVEAAVACSDAYHGSEDVAARAKAQKALAIARCTVQFMIDVHASYIVWGDHPSHGLAASAAYHREKNEVLAAAAERALARLIQALY